MEKKLKYIPQVVKEVEISALLKNALLEGT
jgi:hypothetical protein